MSSRGFAGVVRSNATPPAGGGAGITDGENGLTKVGTKLRLGGANPLIVPTDIDLAGFFLRFLDGGVTKFLVDATNNQFQLGDLVNQSGLSANGSEITAAVATDTVLRLSTFLGQYVIGDVGFQFNGSLLFIDDNALDIQLIPGGFPSLDLDILNLTYRMGDMAGSFTGGFIEVNAAAQYFQYKSFGNQYLVADAFAGIFQFGNINPSTGIQLYMDDNTGEIALGRGTGVLFTPALALEVDAGNYSLGDVRHIANNNYLFIDDANGVVDLEANLPSGNFGGFVGNAANSSAVMFAGLSPNLLSYAVEIQSATPEILVRDNSSRRFLSLQPDNQLFYFGDIDNYLGNGAYILVDNSVSKFVINDATNTMLVNINGVDGFTGTVTPVTSITVVGGIVTNVT